MTLFKATRPDGLSFQAPRVDYASACGTGEVIRHPSRRKTRDDASTYLSVSTSEADCTGFSWPARLFVVEPVGRVMSRLSASPNKRAVSALRVVEELPSWRLFGPQGEEVVALIDKAKTVTADDVARLRSAWGAARAAARGAVRDAAREAARGAAREAAWALAREAAREAAWALVVRDLIPAHQFDVLYGPWRAAMEAA